MAGDAETLVEDLYRQVQPPASWVRLTEELEADFIERQAEASERRVVLTKTLAKLAEERASSCSPSTRARSCSIDPTHRAA